MRQKQIGHGQAYIQVSAMPLDRAKDNGRANNTLSPF